MPTSNDTLVRAAPISPMWNGFNPFLMGGLHSPLQLPGLELWLDTNDLSSLVVDGSNRTNLASDKSGNSGVNVLCLNGVAGNYASAPNNAAYNITDLDLRVYLSLPSWTAGAADASIFARYQTAGQRVFWMQVLTDGRLRLFVSLDGTAILTGTSSTVVPFTAFQTGWVRVTRVASSGVFTFYTGGTGTTPTWVQLGNTVTLGTGSPFNGTSIVEVGSANDGVSPSLCNIYRAQFLNGVDGATAFDANFATAAKLAPSFTESSSNAATVTINTSGATGARISGARDLYQGTAANQPILTIAAGGNYLTFDGSNDYLKAAAFALAQPETVYFVGSQVTWANGDAFFDGNALGNGMAVAQNSLTPALSLFAGTQISDLIAPALNTRSVISAVFSGAASFLRLNRNTAASASVGVESGNGFTLGCVRNTTGFANITASEVLVFSGAHDTVTQDRTILYLARKWKIAV